MGSVSITNLLSHGTVLEVGSKCCNHLGLCNFEPMTKEESFNVLLDLRERGGQSGGATWRSKKILLNDSGASNSRLPTSARPAADSFLDFVLVPA